MVSFRRIIFSSLKKRKEDLITYNVWLVMATFFFLKNDYVMLLIYNYMTGGRQRI